FEVNQKNGWRWNAAKAFLRPVCMSRPNFTLWTLSQTDRLQLERLPDGRLKCVGLTVRHGGQAVAVKARKEVVLSAGSIGTPQLLQLSGIGPGELVQRHGIEV